MLTFDPPITEERVYKQLKNKLLLSQKEDKLNFEVVKYFSSARGHTDIRLLPKDWKMFCDIGLVHPQDRVCVRGRNMPRAETIITIAENLNQQFDKRTIEIFGFFKAGEMQGPPIVPRGLRVLPEPPEQIIREIMQMDIHPDSQTDDLTNYAQPSLDSCQVLWRGYFNGNKYQHTPGVPETWELDVDAIPEVHINNA